LPQGDPLPPLMPNEPLDECRTDNGRCFSRGGWDRTTHKATVQFTDTKIYRFGPMDEAEWIETFQIAVQPGCTWNFHWKDHPPTHWERLGAWPDGLEHLFTT